MSNYKHGDIVVMNRDYNGCYEGENLTYLRPDSLIDTDILKKINGEICFVATDSFDLRDKPEFEIDEIIEVSNHEDFELFDQVYFVADASKVKSFDGDYPIVTASDMGTIQNYKYARKIVEKTYTIKHDCIEYPATKEQYDNFHAALSAVMK